MLSTIPTALSPHETRILQQLARERRVVEAGALLGYSTVMMAQVAISVVSIDKHIGYSGATERLYRANLARAGVEGRVVTVIGDAVPHLPRYDGDLAFIDLTCGYELTRAALLAARTPLIALHDYRRAHCSGVTQLVEELTARGWPVVERADTLIVLARPTGA